MKIKKLYLWFVPLSIVLILGALMIHKVCFNHQKSAIITDSIEITNTGNHPGNNRQHEATIWLGCYKNKLYYYGGGKSTHDKTKYDDSLCVFQNGSLVEVSPLGNGTITILGMVDRYIYYQENTGDYDNEKLYCYDLETNQKILLYTSDFSLVSSLYFANDGSVYFPLFPKYGETAQFVHVLGSSVLGVELLTDGYPLGENMYYVVSEYLDAQVERVLKSSPNNTHLEELPFEQAHKRSIVSYEGGLLVHNEELEELLYRINPDGSVTKLFSVPCLSSISAVNIHGTDAYLSVLRYEKYGEKGMLRYENDTLEGTYRISLIDGSVEKINNMCFNGIYNFDDTGFYCCDQNGNIYKMEFDGTTSPILFVSKCK